MANRRKPSGKTCCGSGAENLLGLAAELAIPIAERGIALYAATKRVEARGVQQQARMLPFQPGDQLNAARGTRGGDPGRVGPGQERRLKNHAQYCGPQTSFHGLLSCVDPLNVGIAAMGCLCL